MNNGSMEEEKDNDFLTLDKLKVEFLMIFELIILCENFD
jgi:hypothetical protein